MLKRRRRLIFYFAPLLVIIVLCVSLGFEIRRIEASARLLAETGQAAIKMLNEYSAGINRFVITRNADKILDCYANNYVSDQEGRWAEELKSDRDGVQVYEWKVSDTQTLHRTEVAERIKQYLQPITAMEESKFKLNAVEQTFGADSAVVRGVLWLRGKRKTRADATEEAFESH